MAGLTSEGFTPLTHDEILDRIKTKLDTLNPGFDFSPDSPDGQLIEIMAYEVSQAWAQLNIVYNSYNPAQASGAALRNLGLITGAVYNSASRSRAIVDLTGVTGTLIPRGSAVSNANGDVFTTLFSVYLPTTTDVVASVAGPTPVDAGDIVNILTPITGWTGVTQPTAGLVGLPPETETAYRNNRNKTVLKNYSSVPDVITARLLDVGVDQARVYNNNTNVVGPDGTPAQTIHVTLNEVVGVTDEDIANIILTAMGLGTPTFGTTSVVITDTQGYPQTINFTKAVAADVFISMDITYLDPSLTAGAEEAIKTDIVNSINTQQAGEDVIISRLYGLITPHGKAQVNSLTIGRSLGSMAGTNIEIFDNEFAQTSIGNISIVATE